MPKQMKGTSWGAVNKSKAGTGVSQLRTAPAGLFQPGKGVRACAVESERERKDRMVG